MALNCLFRQRLPLSMKQFQQIAMSSSVTAPGIAQAIIGNREVVGYGMNGEPTYFDRVDIPMPAVRFKESTPDIQVLREKEKGDWHKLSIIEKKELYRSSFCQTLSEATAPTGEWKAIIGFTLMFMSCAFWMYILQKIYVYGPMPSSFAPERQEQQLQKILDLRMNPVTGIASKYDYEQGKWKE